MSIVRFRIVLLVIDDEVPMGYRVVSQTFYILSKYLPNFAALREDGSSRRGGKKAEECLERRLSLQR